LKAAITHPYGPVDDSSADRISRLPFSARSVLKVPPVFFQQRIGVLLTDALRGGDVVLAGFQPFDDLSYGLVARLFALGVKVGQYLVQALDPDLRIIDKSQYAPTNCRRLRDSAVPSGVLFVR
jgi:hypothetical protein